MRNLVLALSAAAMVAPVAITPVDAQTSSRRTAHQSHQYRHVSYNCRRGHGTTGLLVGGALLGRHIQRHRRCRY